MSGEVGALAGISGDFDWSKQYAVKKELPRTLGLGSLTCLQISPNNWGHFRMKFYINLLNKLGIRRSKMESKEIDFLKWQFDYNLKQISLADNKMQFITFIYLGLATIFFKKGRPIVASISNLCLFQAILIFLNIMFLLFLFCFLYLYWKTISPRTNSTLGKTYKSPIFWKHVSDMSPEEFRGIPFDKRYRDLLDQITITAKIASQKFHYVNLAYKMLMFYFTIFIFVLLLESKI